VVTQDTALTCVAGVSRRPRRGGGGGGGGGGGFSFGWGGFFFLGFAMGFGFFFGYWFLLFYLFFFFLEEDHRWGEGGLVFVWCPLCVFFGSLFICFGCLGEILFSLPFPLSPAIDPFAPLPKSDSALHNTIVSRVPDLCPAQEWAASCGGIAEQLHAPPCPGARGSDA